jgi:protein involved in polysaccharide export with SLBB domain
MIPMTWMRLAVIALALPLLAGGCATVGSGGQLDGGPDGMKIIRIKGHPAPPEGDPVWNYRIVPGDVLSIEGGKNTELSKESIRVDEQGFINLLYIGKIQAAGKTKAELEQDVNDAYKKAQKIGEPQVTVTVLTLFYYVDGQVRMPGKRQYLRETTIYRAIVEANSFTEFAAPSRVVLLRQGPDALYAYTINVSRIMRGQDPDDVVILPNDVIRVPKSVF